GSYKLPQFRKEFSLKKEVRQAVVFVSGMGHFNLFINGEKVGDNFLDPGWTQYDQQALYVSFDVTTRLRQGDNAFGVMLGNGFYNVPRERYLKVLTSFGAPKMIMKMQVAYSDGSSEEIITDESWTTTESPITYSSIYGGEDYDATREQKGWMLPGFDDSQWARALPVDNGAALQPQRSTPLKVRDRLPTNRIYQNGKGSWIYDLGQNFSGNIAVKVRGKAGQEIIFRPAELLNSDSTINQSASGGPFWFAYTTRGDGDEVWRPQFTYYGFRYVQLEGAVPAGKENPDNLPEVEEITGLHTANSAEEAGTFHCSKPMFNQIYCLIDWAMRSNMASVLTDCPHREKLGWLEQAYLMQFSLQYRYNLSRLYEKVMKDMQVAQHQNGMVPTIAPEYVVFASGFEDTPEWGSAFIICPWYIYQWYGDSRLLAEYYPQMQRYLDYLSSRSDGHIVAYGLGDWFDIGPGNPGYSQLTSNGLTATATYYYNTTIMEKIARLLGKSEDAARYNALAKEIKTAFNSKFFDKVTGKYDHNSQTASAISLYVGLVEDENKDKAFNNLIEDIRGRNNALTAGDVGYRYVLRTLEGNGASDVIFDMNSKYDVPGYGWQLAHGATALTESWQAYGFISNNHFMLGHLMEWLFSGLGGLRQDEESAGYKIILIDPQPVGDVKYATTTYDSPYGQIVCRWEKTDDSYTLKVDVPANSEAVVCLPTADTAKVTEYGLPLSEATSVSVSGIENGKLKLKIGSGSYLFQVR
ncbi:MAG: glycoside hydrolase family 78 protein, partial [Prolixibacteraceae bacterium]|nr:glycoside hydrolase family 78 protein [Prolixibacteraceae bacterium]